MFKDYDGSNLRVHVMAGTDEEMGRAHAHCLKDAILRAIAVASDYFKTTEADLDSNISYCKWREGEIEYNAKEFPHFIAETEAIAKYSGIPLRRLFDVAFNGFGVIKRHPPNTVKNECSLIAITTVEGVPAMLSSLDDAAETWPAMGHYKPSAPGRHTFMGITWLGTAGISRGMNAAGLWFGTASCGYSATPGGPLEKQRPYALGYLLRSILETCTTVDDARRFCKEYRFCCNLLFGDAQGGIFAVHQSPNGPYEVTGDDYASLTNAVTDDKIIYDMTRAGITCRESLITTRPRNGFFKDFIQRRNRLCTFEEFIGHFEKRDTVNSWSINNNITVFMTAAMPQKYPRTMWVCRACDPVNGGDFIRLEI
jgi:hypothetical protein